MANLINALTTGVGGLETIADASGSFSFQSDGSTIATVTSSGFSVTGTFDAGSLQVGGSDVVVDTDIGSTVQAYDADTTKNDVANTFTANQTINGNLTVDTNTLYVDSTNNRVGIGTSSPSSGLEVYGTDAASGRIEVTRNTSSMYLGSSGAGGYIQTPDANPLLFYTNAAERMVINSSGNVGIGTSSPLTELNVQGGIGAASPTELTTRANAMFSLSASATNTRLYQGVESGTTVWLQAQNSDNSAKAIAINPVDGNVGIGTSSPSSKLEINNGNLLVGNAVNNFTILVSRTGANASSVKIGAYTNEPDIQWTYTGSGALRFTDATANAERMRIDSSGRVGIGTASPGGKLDIASPSGYYGSSNPILNTQYNSIQTFKMYLESDWYTHLASVLVAGQTNGLAFDTNGAERMRITSTGNVGIGTSSPTPKLDVAGNIGFGTGGTFGAGQLFSDNNWGVILRAKQASPVQAEFAFQNAGGTERMRIDSSGNLKFNSGYGSVATAYGCRAWVNFNGTGTVAISASGNVSSITDNAQGLYTVNMSTAMPNTNYAVTGTAVGNFQGTTGSNGRCGTVSPNLNGTYSTSSFQVITKDSADINFDSSKVGIAVFR